MILSQHQFDINLLQESGSTSTFEWKKNRFPDGQVDIRIDTRGMKQNSPVEIVTRLSTMEDLMLLLETTQVVRQWYRDVNVTISYLYAARMDRKMNEDQPFTLKIIGNILNTQNYGQVTIFDPHSDVTLGVVNNSVALMNTAFIERVIRRLRARNDGDPSYDMSNLHLVSPDGGALKKVYKVAEYLDNFKVVECSKRRSVEDGKILGFSVHCEPIAVPNQTALIVDDICSRGGTFIHLAPELKAKGFENVYLCVSHYEDTADREALKKSGIDGVFTTDSFKPLEKDDFLDVVNFID